MKKNAIKIAVLAFLLVQNFAVFAQGPGGTGDGTGGVEGDGDTTPGTPINTKLVWLAVLGIVFAIYAFKNRKKAV